MTRTSNDFLGLAAGLLEAALRGGAFFAIRALAKTTFFLVAGLLLEVTRLFVDFRGKVFCATARFAFGRLALATTRRFAPVFDEGRLADARDDERLSPFETALMRLQIEGLKGVDVSRRCGGRIT